MVTPEILLHAVRYAVYVADTNHEAMPVVIQALYKEHARPKDELLPCVTQSVALQASSAFIQIVPPQKHAHAACVCLACWLLGGTNIQSKLQGWAAGSHMQAAEAPAPLSTHSLWTSMSLMLMLLCICCCRCSDGVCTHSATDAQLVPAIL